MSLVLSDKWIWDFWLAEDNGQFHAFYLQAPRSIKDPDLRHWHVSVGHAVSEDLSNWTVVGDALAPSAIEAWDDYTTWTGSIIRHDDLWHLFYTGTSRSEDGMVQRIGLATSHDLHEWEKVDGPLIEADPRWYELRGEGWHDEAWRDPWVFKHADGDFHALITARRNTGDRFDRGCIAHARSSDLRNWEVLQPVTTAGGFGQLEVPQVHAVGDAWYLVFCSDLETQSVTRQAAGPGTGTYYAVSDSPLGPFDVGESHALQADLNGTFYAGRLVETDGLDLLAWRRHGPDGEFVGELADPVRVGRNGSRQLHIRSDGLQKGRRQ